MTQSRQLHHRAMTYWYGGDQVRVAATSGCGTNKETAAARPAGIRIPLSLKDESTTPGVLDARPLASERELVHVRMAQNG